MGAHTAYANRRPQPSTWNSSGRFSVRTGTAPSATVVPPGMLLFCALAALKLAAGEPPVQLPRLAASRPNEALDSVIVASVGHGRRLLLSRNASSAAWMASSFCWV